MFSPVVFCLRPHKQHALVAISAAKLKKLWETEFDFSNAGEG